MDLLSPWNGPGTHPQQRLKKCSVWKYAQADFEKTNRLIEATDWTFLHNETNVDLASNIRGEKFMEIMEEGTSKVTISTKHNLPRMNSTIKVVVVVINMQMSCTHEKHQTTYGYSL